MHNSLLIVTFDESDDHADNHIPTIVFGAHVRPGRYADRITHYNVFSTLLVMNNLPPLATAVTSLPITTIWDQKVSRLAGHFLQRKAQPSKITSGLASP